MSAPADVMKTGHYARKQLYGGAWLITWSHRRRFQLACRFAAQFPGKRLLDYGCGDGTFLAMACEGPRPGRVGRRGDLRRLGRRLSYAAR